MILVLLLVNYILVVWLIVEFWLTHVYFLVHLMGQSSYTGLNVYDDIISQY